MRLLQPLREMLTAALAALLLFQLVSGLLVSPLFALFPVYVEKELHRASDFTGAVRAFFVVMSGIMALAGGAVCDAVGRKNGFLLGMTGVASAGAMFLVDPQWMLPLAVFSGMMFGLGAVAGQAYLIEAAPDNSLALATACYFTMGTIGNAVGSAVAGWIAEEWANGYRILGWLMTVGQLVVLLAAWRVMPSVSGPRPAEAESTAGGDGYPGLLRRPEVWALLALRCLPTFYWGAVTLLMPLLLFRATGTETAAGYYTSASLVIAAICQLTAGRIVDRIGPRVPVITAVSLIALSAAGQGISGASAAGLVVFGLLGSGAAWSLSITMTTLVRELSSEATRAKLLGMTHVAWSSGFLAGTLGAGYLARDSAGAPLAFLLSAAGSGVAIVCAALVTAHVRSGLRREPAGRSGGADLSD